MPGSYVAFNLLPSDPFDLLASCIVSLTQRINKYVCFEPKVNIWLSKHHIQHISVPLGLLSISFSD